MTDRKLMVLLDFMKENLYVPNITEAMILFSYKSKGGVHKYYKKLKSKNRLSQNNKGIRIPGSKMRSSIKLRILKETL